MDGYTELNDNDDHDDNSVGLLNNSSAQSSFLFTNLNLSPKEHIQRLNIFSKCCAAVSLFFWVWAIINTTKMDYGGVDLGIFSFFGSGVSSAYLYYRTKFVNDSSSGNREDASGTRNGRSDSRIEQDFKPIGACGRVVIVATYWIVCANYLLGVLIAFNIGATVMVSLAVYCIVFTILWMMIALIGWMLIGRTMNLVISTIEEEDEDDEVL